MQAAQTDRNLLYAVVALQLDFIDRDRLVAAMTAWAAEKHTPIGRILERQGALSGPRRAMLDGLVDEHVRQHGDDPARSLASLSSVESTRETLSRLVDDDLRESLGHLGHLGDDRPDDDPDRTRSQPPEPSTQAGDVPTVTLASAASGAVSRFRILRPHARGGLGAVSVALDTELNRQVALKQIQDSHADHPESRSRFLLEAEITGGLEHPGIVPVYSLGHDPAGRPFYAMRFIKGDSLKQAIERFHSPGPERDPGRRTLELQKLLRRFLDVCEAVAYAHSRGVLHRDLKPGNIMVGQYGETLVVDWGLAKVIGSAEASGEATLRPSSASGSSDTLPGSTIGTPSYMSPEQASGDLDRLGPRSDVYSLGATLYALLTGKAPVEGPDTPTILDRVRRGDIPPPRQVNPEVPPALEAVCRKAMALRPEDRHADPIALAADLEAYLADEPVSAWREPPLVRLSRWARRHRTPVASGVAALAIAAASLAVSTALLGRANERTRAQERIARENLEASRALVSSMFETVVERLPDVQDMDEVQREILEAALAFYTDFVAERSGDPSVRLEVARASRKVGEIRDRLDQSREAELAFRDGIGELEAYLAGHPDDPRALDTLVPTLIGLGNLLDRTDRPEEAEQVLRRALGLGEARVSGSSEPDPDAREALALACFWLGLHSDHYNRLDEARRLYGRAIAIQEQLLREDPDDPGTRSDLARSFYELGYLIARQGDVEGAIAMYERLVGLQEELVRESPSDSGYQGALNSSLSYLGALYSRAGRMAEAERVHSRAVAIRQRLVDLHPEVASHRVGLTKSLGNLANHYERVGRPEQAERILRRGLEIGETLREDHPDVLDYTLTTIAHLVNLGNALNGQGRHAEAIEVLDRGIASLESVRQGSPNNATAARLLCSALGFRGDALLGLDRPAEALPLFEQAASLDEGLSRGGLLALQALALARMGDEARCLSRLSGLPEGVAPVVIARCHASLASIGPEHADRHAPLAVSSLRLARSLGLLDLPSRRAELDAGPAFGLIRSRPEFRAFLADLAFPAWPFAGSPPILPR